MGFHARLCHFSLLEVNLTYVHTTRLALKLNAQRDEGVDGCVGVWEQNLFYRTALLISKLRKLFKI